MKIYAVIPLAFFVKVLYNVVYRNKSEKDDKKMNYESMKRTNSTPLYQQLVEWILEEIATGELLPGQRLDSVREISDGQQTNPNTVQRALTILEEQGVIYTRTTAGKFVSQDAEFISTLRERVAKKRTAEFVASARRLNLSDDEIISYVEEAIKKK